MEATGQAQDLVAARDVVARADEHQSDADQFARLLTPDAIVVNFGGRRVRGRAAIHDAMKQALATPMAAVLTRNDVEHVDFLRPDVALVSCVKHISDQRGPSASDTAGPMPQQGSSTFVLVKEHGDWLIASVQTTPRTQLHR